MAAILLNIEDYNEIYAGCRNAVSKDSLRKGLLHIDLRASDGWCTATALDGFILTEVRVPCKGFGEMRVRPVKAPKECDMVEIATSGTAKEDAYVIINFIASDGELVTGMKFPISKEPFPGAQKILSQALAEEHDYIYVNAAYLKRVLDAFIKKHDSNTCISIPRNKNKAIVLSNEHVTGLVLPLAIRDTRYGDSLKPRGRMTKEDANG